MVDFRSGETDIYPAKFRPAVIPHLLGNSHSCQLLPVGFVRLSFLPHPGICHSCQLLPPSPSPFRPPKSPSHLPKSKCEEERECARNAQIYGIPPPALLHRHQIVVRHKSTRFYYPLSLDCAARNVSSLPMDIAWTIPNQTAGLVSMDCLMKFEWKWRK
jgi:hypothetical protein